MKPLQINCPTAIGINIAGQIIIADSRNHRLLITDIFGEPVKESVELGLFKPIDLTIDNNNDRIIVIDSSLIKLFDKDGVFQFQILPVLTNRDLLPKLTGVTVDENGDIFVCDSSNKRLQRFKEDGTFQDFLDFQSTIQHPDRILDIGSHEVIVSDVSESTLYIVNTLKNTFYEIRSIGREGICPGEFVRPRGLARDQNGSIAVADSDNHRVQLVTTDGRCQGSIGRLGSSPGCLDHPSDVAIHPKGFVVVADTRNNRIVVYN